MENFFKLLGAGSIGSWVLLVFVLVFFIVIVLAVVKWFETGFKKLKVRKLITPIGTAEFGKERGEEIIDSPHSKCIHSKDIIQLLVNQRKNIREVDKIEFMYIYRDMMNCAQDVIDNITARMESVFLILLHDKKGSETLFADRAFISYQNALKLMKRDILKEFLRMVRENNFIKREKEGTFIEYRDRKAENILNDGLKALNRYYVEEVPSREEIYDRNREISKDPRNDFDILGMLKRCIESMKELSKMHHGNINNLEKDIDDQIACLFNSGQGKQ